MFVRSVFIFLSAAAGGVCVMFPNVAGVFFFFLSIFILLFFSLPIKKEDGWLVFMFFFSFYHNHTGLKQNSRIHLHTALSYLSSSLHHSFTSEETLT